MSIVVSGVGNTTPPPSVAPKDPADGKPSGSFQDLLDGAMGSLGRLEAEADSSTARLAAGEPVELHEVLLATERLSIAFQLMVQVRNKVIEAYQEVMRMQV